MPILRSCVFASFFRLVGYFAFYIEQNNARKFSHTTATRNTKKQERITGWMSSFSRLHSNGNGNDNVSGFIYRTYHIVSLGGGVQFFYRVRSDVSL